MTSPTVTPPIAQPMNWVVPTGGVLRPSAQLTRITIPNCTGSMPYWMAIGRKIGVQIRIVLAMSYGMDPVQFGMVMLINCALGLNTPPVGTTQFIGCAIGGISVGQVMRTILPFYGALIAALLLVTYVPAFSLALPNLFLGKF